MESASSAGNACARLRLLSVASHWSSGASFPTKANTNRKKKPQVILNELKSLNVVLENVTPGVILAGVFPTSPPLMFSVMP